jgi:hypothetical protein
MTLIVFEDKSKPPQDKEVMEVLRRKSAHWVKLRALLHSQYEPLTETWKFYSRKWGWTLQLKRKKRAVLYLTPHKGYFAAGFVLGEKAVKSARDSDLPDSILNAINSARKYAEGRGIRIEVKTKKDVDVVEKLAAIKMAN